MDLGLAGSTVLVAGASRGIGLGIAQGFLREGARVMFTGRTAAVLEQAVNDSVASLAGEASAAPVADRVAAFCGDMTATGDISAALAATAAAFGAPDVVIANVGGGYLKPGWDIADDDLDAALEHNLTGTVRLVRESLRAMAGRSGANVVVISSIAGVDAMGAPFSYGVAKAGLNHFVAAMARLIGPEQRINAVAPGNILFEDGSWDQSVKAAPERVMRWVKREVALQRFGTVAEIADVALFLASPRAGFVTGATWIADGGQVRSTS